MIILYGDCRVVCQGGQQGRLRLPGVGRVEPGAVLHLQRQLGARHHHHQPQAGPGRDGEHAMQDAE